LVLGDERLQPIVLMSPDGSQSRTVSEGGERGTAPALSPGSSYLAYVEVTSTREQLIKVLSLSRPGAPWFWGGTPRLDRQDMPTWSPDGNWIAFTASSFADQLPDLYRVTGFASGEPILERLTQDNAIESWPSFSPDGARIVYAVDLSPSGGATELRVMEIASRQASNLTGNGATLIESSPDWSPVPERPYIVFQGQEAGSAQSDLYWVPADGSAPPEKLFESEASEIHPRFSPDGRFILFSSDRTGNWDVFIYEIASGEIFQVTTADTVEIATDWAP
jgi:TolB protein